MSESPQDYRWRPTSGIDALVRSVQTTAQKGRESTSNLLRSMGVRARPGLLSSTDFDGDGGRTNLGTKGWMLGAADGGDSFFVLNGRLVIEDLDAIVEDLNEQQDALEDEVERIDELVSTQSTFDTGWANSGALSLTTSETTVASFTLTIPAGYTRALVVVNGSVGIVNPTGSTSSVACRVYAQPSGGIAQWGPRRWQGALAGMDAAVYSQLYQAYTGLTGGTFSFWINMLNAGPGDWGATPGGGTVEAQVTYMR